ncbi:MAG TPA: hypothetical protein VEW92_10420 [Nitrososphaeraceae archaeon]|nr:hypothetical protein [Nitrososphaeraceae archaeon]
MPKIIHNKLIVNMLIILNPFSLSIGTVVYLSGSSTVCGLAGYLMAGTKINSLLFYLLLS